MNKTIDKLLEKSLQEGMSYKSYIALVNKLLKEGKSTGQTQNEDYLNYSKLSERRMKRWDKTFKMAEEDKRFFENWREAITFLTVSEGWCGDAAHALPIINKITEIAPKLNLKIVLRDDNDELIGNFLTNGAKSIPKLIALDEENNVLFTWGARPKEATILVNEFKEKHGELTQEFKEDLQMWYNKDKGQSILKDIKSELEFL
jgi:hypothetical protein